jgi:hypothetical protein
MLELTNKQFEAFHSSGEPVRGPASAIPRYETPLLLCNRMQQVQHGRCYPNIS